MNTGVEDKEANYLMFKCNIVIIVIRLPLSTQSTDLEDPPQAVAFMLQAVGEPGSARLNLGLEDKA